MVLFEEPTHVPHNGPEFGPCNVEGRSTPCCGPEKQQKTQREVDRGKTAPSLNHTRRNSAIFLFLFPTQLERRKKIEGKMVHESFCDPRLCHYSFYRERERGGQRRKMLCLR